LLRHHVEPELDHLIHLMRYVYSHRDQAMSLGRRAAEVARLNWTWRHAAVRLGSVLGFQWALEQVRPC
jgi:hypothetical protein